MTFGGTMSTPLYGPSCARSFFPEYKWFHKSALKVHLIKGHFDFDFHLRNIQFASMHLIKSQSVKILSLFVCRYRHVCYDYLQLITENRVG